MSKQLYEEALADVKKVKQVAEDNAKRAVLDAVTPRIRDFIDRALLDEHALDGDPETGEMDGMPRAPGTPPGLGGTEGGEGEMLTDLVASDPDARVPVTAGGPAAAITPPDAEGKVTLDIDALCSTQPGAPVPAPMFGEPAPRPEEAEYEISLESVDALQPVVAASQKNVMTNKDLVANIKKISENINLFKNAGKTIRSTKAFNDKIAQMISSVEDMYDYVQEQVADPAKKNLYETTLEAGFKALNQIQETTKMSNKTTKRMMNEADVTLKLTGLPDDIDLDSVGVDLISGEDEEGLDDGMGGDQDQGGDDLGDLDLGGQQGGQEQEQQMETRRLSDDTVVEIDENMLRREIARMRNLREEHSATGRSETKAQSWGNGADHFDSFGDGKDEGEVLDQDIVDQTPAKAALPLGEADGEQDDLDEADQDQDDLDEADQDDLDEADFGMDQAQDNLASGGNVAAASTGAGASTNKQNRMPEALRRIGFERRFQTRAKARAATLKREAAVARSKKNVKRFTAAKKEYEVVARRFNESVARTKKLTTFVANAKKIQESRSNSGTARPAESTAENALLRKKLAETNLFNAKLLYTNKILQSEQLTSKQKSQVIKQLDEAKNAREVKLVYDSLSSTLGSTSKTVNENRERQVLGSSSRTTRPASTPQALNEGYEAERWAELAGITKR